MVHVRFDGKSFDLDEEAVGIEDQASPPRIRERIARYLDVDRERLEPLVVERTPAGDILVRPEAVFG